MNEAGFGGRRKQDQAKGMKRMVRKDYTVSMGTIRYWVSAGGEKKRWLVFLPGLSADHTLFDLQMEHFSREYACLVWDAPAHGLSRPFDLAFSMRDLARWLHEILEIEGAEKPILIGQSLGGYIAQIYMDMYPGGVSGFVSIDSCPLSRKYYSGWELALLKRTKWMYMSIPFGWLIKWGIAGTSCTEYGRNLMRRMWSVYGKREYCELADHGFRMLAQAVEEHDEYRIDCPALLLCGEKDLAGSAKRYNRQWARQDGMRLQWIAGAGHNANTDAPQQVNRMIGAFVSSCFTGGMEYAES